jgi:c-di-GMP-binding flagellar brake protein YcgR
MAYNRRECYRVPTLISLDILKHNECVSANEECFKHFTRTRGDLSDTGIAFYSKEDVQEGSEIRLALRFGELKGDMHFPDGVVVVNARNVRKIGSKTGTGCDVAFSFHAPSLIKNTLFRMVFMRQREEVARHRALSVPG